MPVNNLTPSPQSSVHRKPANYPSSFRSVSPLPNQTHHSSSSVNNVQNYAHPAPLQSFPSQTPLSPSITPPIPVSNHNFTQPNYSSSVGTSATSSLPQSSSASLLKPLSGQEIDGAIQTCLRLQTEAVTEHNKRPFAAILLAPDNVTVLATHNSLSHYQHAESELARLAAAQYGAKYLEKCTLLSTWEPCAMCAGTIYWAQIGRVLYVASEARLKELTGANNPENMTMSLPCRVIFEAGQRKVEVVGPVNTWEQRVVDDCTQWWKEHNAAHKELVRSTNSMRDNASVYSKRTSITIYNPEDSVLGSIGEDGEYQADLKIDWMP